MRCSGGFDLLLPTRVLHLILDGLPAGASLEQKILRVNIAALGKKERENKPMGQEANLYVARTSSHAVHAIRCHTSC